MYAVNTTTEIPITREASITDACLCHDNMGIAESFPEAQRRGHAITTARGGPLAFDLSATQGRGGPATATCMPSARDITPTDAPVPSASIACSATIYSEQNIRRNTENYGYAEARQ